ncbi:MAG: hypothetical protein Tsb0034_16160 [Ekhidna sp.]
MKKIIFPLLLATLFLVNCEDDDKSGALIGVWIGESREVIECTDDSKNRIFDLDCTNTSCFRLEILADGTYSYKQGTVTDFGDWSGGGTSLRLCTDEEGETLCTDYIIEENTSVTLGISTTDEATACKTIIFFQRELEEEDDDGTQ